MSDSEFDDNELDQMDHVTGPIEDAWKMKIPDFKPDDNKNGEEILIEFNKLINLNVTESSRTPRGIVLLHTLSQIP